MVRSLLIPLMGLYLFLPACSSQWSSQAPPEPKTYLATPDQVERTVGKLRRLLVLPALVNTTDCPGYPADTQLSDDLKDAIKPYLVDWKGYQVVEYDSAIGEINEFVNQTGNWQVDRKGSEAPPSDIKSVLVGLSRDNNVDGIIVVHGDIRCLNTTDMILYFMIIGMPNLFNKTLGENLSAGIYDGETGGLIWLSHVNVLPPGVGGGSQASSWASLLFSKIENAVPEVLIEPKP